MAVWNRITGEIKYEGRVYSSRGSFNCDSHVDIVEIILDDGSIKRIELRDPSPWYAKEDATEEFIALRDERVATRQRIYHIRKLREAVSLAAEVGLKAREFLDLCAGWSRNPNWRRTQAWRGLGAEIAYASLPLDPFPVSRQTHRKLRDFKEGLLSKFEKSLVQQSIDWAKTDSGQRKYDQPLSKKQLSYLDKDWASAA